MRRSKRISRAEKIRWLLCFNGTMGAMVVACALSSNPDAVDLGAFFLGVTFLLDFCLACLLFAHWIRGGYRPLRRLLREKRQRAKQSWQQMKESVGAWMTRTTIRLDVVLQGLCLFVFLLLAILSASQDPMEHRLGLALTLLAAVTISAVVLRRAWPRSKAQTDAEIESLRRLFRRPT